MSQKLVDQFVAAFRVSTPLVAINTTDQVATMGQIIEAVSDDTTIVHWDYIQGLTAGNKFSVDKVNALRGSDDETVANPVLLLQRIRELPKKSVCFMVNAHMWIDEPSVRQAIWNLRDIFKRSRRMLVLLGPDVRLASELVGDTVLLDEPLPDQDQLRGIARAIFDAAKVKPDDDVLERVVEAVQGLPAFQSEQVIAMSMKPGNGCDEDAVWERKRKQIEMTPSLAVNRAGITFDDIGGVEEVKDYVRKIMRGKSRPNAVVFIDEGEKMFAGQNDTSGVSQDQLGQLLSYMQDHNASGLILVGPPGCLSGDTVLLYRRGKRNSGRRITLRRLFQKFNGVPVEGGRGEVTPWHRPADTFLHSYDHASGTVFYNRVISVMSSGIKPCITLTVSSGEVVRLTSDHPILTPDGFVAAGELLPGSEVICRGDMLPQKTEHRAPRMERYMVRTLRYYTSGCIDNTIDPTTGKEYGYRRQTRARLVYEAHMNGLPYDRYLEILKTGPADKAAKFTTLADDMDLHHKNGNAMDDRLENLEPLSKAEHTTEHVPLSRFNVCYTQVCEVVHVAQSCDCDVYDIQMTAPANNFATADGLIVHNTAKSAVSKAAGNEAGIPTITFDPGAAKGSLVGQSEAQFRAALKVISAVSNDKSLWIMTCNNISNLPPELKRRFKRGIFYFDLPSPEEREAIWTIYERKFEIAEQPRPWDEGWTGAEIEQCCFTAWDLGVTLMEAATKVVPVAKSAARQIEALRTMATGTFLSASHPGVYRREAVGGHDDSARELAEVDS